MRDTISKAMKDAMKGREKRRLSTLRLISAAIKDRDIAARGNGGERVSDDNILEILTKMIRQRTESIKMYEEGGRLELADQEREEVEIIREFLPRQLPDDEIEIICAAVMQETGATGLRDMGKCMAILKERYTGQMDFGKASGIIKGMF